VKTDGAFLTLPGGKDHISLTQPAGASRAGMPNRGTTNSPWCQMYQGYVTGLELGTMHAAQNPAAIGAPCGASVAGATGSGGWPCDERAQPANVTSRALPWFESYADQAES
jgi:hypothetical protein